VFQISYIKISKEVEEDISSVTEEEEKITPIHEDSSFQNSYIFKKRGLT